VLGFKLHAISTAVLSKKYNPVKAKFDLGMEGFSSI
jgi:hypothetical protein